MIFLLKLNINMKSVAAEEATKVIAEETTNSVACGVDCSMRRTKVSSHVGAKQEEATSMKI